MKFHLLVAGLLAVPAASAFAASLEPKAQAVIDALDKEGGAPIHQMPLAASREFIRKAQAGEVKKPAADIEDRIIPGGDIGEVSVRIVRPKGVPGLLPAVIYLHGGGWVLGDKDTHDLLIRELAQGTQAAIVFVNYSPSPEAHFPVAIEQAYATAKWVAENGKKAKLDGSRLAIAGDSAGGDMTAAVTLMAKQRGGPKLRYQVLFSPVTDSTFTTGSYLEFQNGPLLTKPTMEWFWQQYVRTDADRVNILAAPLRASLEELSGLPPALVITSENDVLRDEGEAYARKLAQAGVSVTGVRYLGTFHDFMMFNAVSDTSAFKSAIQQASSALKDALKK
ncbi:alpha/beta hydrolase [Stigmatella sp. ncwal1]|uniref:Alpha/beta hydrolase n=1 Tax=Stigmatella ashevillensis TaxID=2995309 RepID=A0ABT5D6L3_9BACT|nr:alpha/beta hydrolase [Stigmatella ashevillena]MDC0709300.1 alpha/beta hydrolase [Stigmatella ashevillena]